MTTIDQPDSRVFECFRVGTHTSMNGRETTWTRADLDQIVSDYRSRPNSAPLVLGHPANNGPEMGTVRELVHRNGVLHAVADVSGDLINLVRRGYYKKVSAAFDKLAVGWRLRHIGFLGSTPPGVKGMASLAFATAPNHACFAESTGNPKGIAPGLAPFVPPPGWVVDPDAMPLFNKALEVQADCPAMSFAECATIAQNLLYPELTIRVIR